MDAVTRRELKEVIWREIELAEVSYPMGSLFDRVDRLVLVERILDEIEIVLKRRKPHEGTFDPLGGASRGVGRCTCLAGRGTNPSCPVHP